MNRIKELRQSKGLSQAELAQKVGISEQSVSFYENDRRKPKIETWKKLADFFNASVPFLQGLTEPKNRLKELRQKKNLTLKTLGKHVGILDSTLSQYESGKREPGQEVWQKLAYYFGTSVSYIRGDLDTEYLEKLIELLMLFNFPKIDLSYGDIDIEDDIKPYISVEIMSQICKLLGYDSKDTFLKICEKVAELADDTETLEYLQEFKNVVIQLMPKAKGVTEKLLNAYDNLKEK